MSLNRYTKLEKSINMSKKIEEVKTSETSSVHVGSFLMHVKAVAPDAILGMKQKYKVDKDPRKINLSVGAYRTNDGKPYVLSCIKKAAKIILNDPKQHHEYLPIDGLAEFRDGARKFLFGKDCKPLLENRIATVQTLSGTGSLRIGAEFISKFMPNTTVYLSNPTWGNHKKIMRDAGVPWSLYSYWDNETRGLDFKGFCKDLLKIPKGSIILLHACAHNPTGVDPTKQQWKKICEIMKERNHFPYFDTAYQGFASGDLEKDAFAIRYFVEQGFEMIVSQSFAKNFGLYGQRAGCLHIVSPNPKVASAIVTQLKGIIRPMYSNPPKYGATLVATVLNTPELTKEWFGELKLMSGRIQKMRHLLVEELKELGTPGDWSHVTKQIGMFAFTGLSPQQCDTLIKKYHVYLLTTGRISLAGITTDNVKYLAKSIHAVVVDA